MPGSLSSQRPIPAKEFLEDKTIAYPGAHKFDSLRLARHLNAQVGHQGPDNAFTIAALVTILTQDKEDAVPIDKTALGVRQHYPVGVTIKCDSHICATLLHELAQSLRISRSGFPINIEPVWFDAGAGYFSTQFPQYKRPHLVCCTVGTIDCHLESIQSNPGRQRVAAMLRIARQRINQAFRLAKRLRSDRAHWLRHQGVNRAFCLIIQFFTRL